MIEYEGTIYNIPPGIVSCFLEDDEEKEATILSLSSFHVTVRLAKNVENKRIKIGFAAFFWEAEGYEKFGAFDGVLAEKIKKDTHIEICYEIEDQKFQEMVKKIEQQIYQYIYLKMNSYGNEFSKKIIGYPEERDYEFSTTFEEWRENKNRKKQIERLKNTIHTLGVELAVSLENVQLCQEYCDDRLEKKIGLSFTRLYIGNAFCHNQFPTEQQLLKILDKAKKETKKITLVLTYLKDSIFERQCKILEMLFLWCEKEDENIEIEMNDLGWLDFFDIEGENKKYAKRFSYNYGRLLNKRRKDPRIIYKNRWQQLKEKVGENSINNEEYLSYLKSKGITRVENESCGYVMKGFNIKTSVHIPFYQTNTSQYCPLQAIVKEQDRGKQSFVYSSKDIEALSEEEQLKEKKHQEKKGSCDMPCMKYVLLYPEHLSLVGRYNSIFALDTWLCEHYETLLEYKKGGGMDRIVWNDV